MRTLPLVIESGGFNLRTLATLIRRVCLTQKAEIVVVDYVQLVSNRLHGQSRATEVAGVSSELKRLAVELGICIIAAAQLNKGPEEREGGRPQIRDIRESEAIAHDADQVIFLVRPDLRGGQESPYLMLAKNRHGPTVERIPLHYDAQHNLYRQRALRAVG
jgi:replicative DNA helicase